MVGFALFRAGRIGAVRRSSDTASSKARLVAIHAPSPPAGDAIAARHGARSAHSAAEVLGDRSVEAIADRQLHRHSCRADHRGGAGRQHLFGRSISTWPGWSSAARRSPAPASRCRSASSFGDPSHAALAAAVEAGEIGTLEQLVITSRDPAIAPVDYLRCRAGSFAT